MTTSIFARNLHQNLWRHRQVRATSSPTAESDEHPENRGHNAPQPPVFALTIREAANAAKISRSMLYTYIRSGALAAKKCGARTIILVEDLEAFLRSRPSLPAKGPRNGGSD